MDYSAFENVKHSEILEKFPGLEDVSSEFFDYI